MATTSRKSEEGSSTCPNCDTKMRRLASENAKLRSKLQEVTGRRDHYAKLYYEALAELETYKRKIEWIVKDLAEELVPAGGEHGPRMVSKNGLQNGFRDAESVAHGPVHDHGKPGVPIYRTKHHLQQYLCKGSSFDTDPMLSKSAPMLPQHSPQQAPSMPHPQHQQPRPSHQHPHPQPQPPHLQHQHPQTHNRAGYQHGPPLHVRHQQAPPPPPQHPPPPVPPKFLQLQRRPTVPLPGGKTPPELSYPCPLTHTPEEFCDSCSSCVGHPLRMANSKSNAQSIDSACFCTGSDTSDSPIYDENQLPVDMGPPSPYRALRQRSLRNKMEQPTWVPIHRPRGRSETHQIHLPGYIKKSKARARRVASDPDIFGKKGHGSLNAVPVHVTHYQSLNLREMNELSEFLGTPECNFSALEIVDSHLLKDGMMRALCSGLKKNTSVHELSLPHNEIGSPSLEILFGMLLKTPTNITTLRLCSNNIGIDCFGVLKDFLLDTNLKTLDLRSNAITTSETHCAQLRDVNNGCEILFSQSSPVIDQSPS